MDNLSTKQVETLLLGLREAEIYYCKRKDKEPLNNFEDDLECIKELRDDLTSRLLDLMTEDYIERLHAVARGDHARVS